MKQPKTRQKGKIKKCFLSDNFELIFSVIILITLIVGIYLWGFN